MALGTDESRCGKTTGKTGFLCCPTCTCIVFGRVPRPEYCYIANYTLPDGDDGSRVSRARSAARAYMAGPKSHSSKKEANYSPKPR